GTGGAGGGGGGVCEGEFAAGGAIGDGEFELAAAVVGERADVGAVEGCGADGVEVGAVDGDQAADRADRGGEAGDDRRQDHRVTRSAQPVAARGGDGDLVAGRGGRDGGRDLLVLIDAAHRADG